MPDQPIPTNEPNPDDYAIHPSLGIPKKVAWALGAGVLGIVVGGALLGLGRCGRRARHPRHAFANARAATPADPRRPPGDNRRLADYKSAQELNDTPLVATFDQLRVVSAKYVPWHDRDRGASASLPSGFSIGPDTTPDDIPVPDAYPDLIHQPTAAEFLETGRIVVESMRRILAADGFAFVAGQRVLDFGCFNGRLLRWLLDEARAGVEFWGVDIDAHAIEWVAARMSPPFQFAVTTTEPHLPFPQDHFDLIYAGSVFTHMADLAVAWLLELKRVLKPGGRAYLTFNDEVTIARILEQMAGLLRRAEVPRSDRQSGRDAGRGQLPLHRPDALREHLLQPQVPDRPLSAASTDSSP